MLRSSSVVAAMIFLRSGGPSTPSSQLVVGSAIPHIFARDFASYIRNASTSHCSCLVACCCRSSGLWLQQALLSVLVIVRWPMVMGFGATSL